MCFFPDDQRLHEEGDHCQPPPDSQGNSSYLICSTVFCIYSRKFHMQLILRRSRAGSICATQIPSLIHPTKTCIKHVGLLTWANLYGGKAQSQR